MGKEEYIPSSGTKWNFDDAESILIFEIKKQFVSDLILWRLEDAFWKYKALVMEVKPLIEKELNEKTKVEQSIKDLSLFRNEYNLIKDPDSETKGKYYELLEEKYIEICLYIKEHGLYFTEYEGEDYDET